MAGDKKILSERVRSAVAYLFGRPLSHGIMAGDKKTLRECVRGEFACLFKLNSIFCSNVMASTNISIHFLSWSQAYQVHDESRVRTDQFLSWNALRAIPGHVQVVRIEACHTIQFLSF